MYTPIESDEDFPASSPKFVNLMTHVDKSFPDMAVFHDSNISSISTLRQYLYLQQLEWSHCFEEIHTQLETFPYRIQDMYFIGDEFK